MPDGNAPRPAKINQAKGKPWIHWVSKRGIEEIFYFPAQEVERFDPYKEIEKGGWSNLLFHGDNKEVMGHLLHKFRGQVDLVYIDPPFDSKADYVRQVQLRGPDGKQIAGEEQSLLEQVQYNDLWAKHSIIINFSYVQLGTCRTLLRLAAHEIYNVDKTPFEYRESTRSKVHLPDRESSAILNPH